MSLSKALWNVYSRRFLMRKCLFFMVGIASACVRDRKGKPAAAHNKVEGCEDLYWMARPAANDLGVEHRRRDGRNYPTECVVRMDAAGHAQTKKGGQAKGSLLYGDLKKSIL